jgi:hypothetical protein
VFEYCRPNILSRPRGRPKERRIHKGRCHATRITAVFLANQNRKIEPARGTPGFLQGDIEYFHIKFQRTMVLNSSLPLHKMYGICIYSLLHHRRQIPALLPYLRPVCTTFSMRASTTIFLSLLRTTGLPRWSKEQSSKSCCTNS